MSAAVSPVDGVVCTGRRHATPNVSGMHAIRIVAAVSWPSLRRQMPSVVTNTVPVQMLLTCGNVD